jgi:surfeit locus 1 family protein
MKRLPPIPTLFVAAAAAVMIALGIWQLQRADWKERMLAELAANQQLPALDLDPLLANGNPAGVPLAFRRVLVTCHSGNAAPAMRASRSRAGAGGYGLFVPCRPGAAGLAGRIEVNAGWTADPRIQLRPRIDGIAAGLLGTVEGSGPVILTAATPAPGLEPSSAPSIDDIPNNHMAYAFQWFFFAATALVIYALALRRRRRSVAPGPPEP